MVNKRARKLYFYSGECTLKLKFAEEKLETVREKLSSTISNERKHAVWENIYLIGVAKRSATDLKEKWRAMRNEARKNESRQKLVGKTRRRKATSSAESNISTNHRAFWGRTYFFVDSRNGVSELGKCCAINMRIKC